MWVTALLGASTSFVESTLAQKYRVPDPLYGGWRGGPAYYLHVLAERKRGKKLKRSVCAALFAMSGLICWCGISQVISNSVSSSFQNAFNIQFCFEALESAVDRFTFSYGNFTHDLFSFFYSSGNGRQ